MSRSSRLKLAAYHEAGHAVLADHFGVLEEVCLEPTPMTRFVAADEDIACCVSYGGVLAQAKYQRRSPQVIDWLTGGHKDLQYIGQVVAFRVQALRQVSDELKAWRETAREILRSRWPAVRLVASALLAEGRLDAHRVRELVASAG